MTDTAIAETVRAACRDVSLQPVTVLMDPADSMVVTRPLLEAHSPAGGFVVMHPTVGAGGAKSLAHDMLAALGRPLTRLVAEKISGPTAAWHAAITWCVADNITDVVVLRAHLLAAERWEQLLELWRCTGVRLVMVCHVRIGDHDLANLLDDAPYRIVTDVHSVMPDHPAARPQAAFTGSTRPRQPAAGIPTLEPALPAVPDSDVTRFRADAWRRLPAEDFGRVDAFYSQGLDTACAWLAENARPFDHRDIARHRRYPIFPTHLRPTEVAAGVRLLEGGYSTETLRTLAAGLLCVSRAAVPHNFPMPWEDHADVQQFLTSLVAKSPSRRHTVTLIRGAQAGFLLHGVLLGVPDNLTQSAGGPGLTSVPFSDQTAESIRTGIASPIQAATLATVLFTGVDAASLVQTTISGLSDDGTTLLIRTKKSLGGTPGDSVAFAIPPPAQPLLRAARTFLHLRGLDPTRRLLSTGLGPDLDHLRAAAECCHLPLPIEPCPLQLSWHAITRCWWVNRPLHSSDVAEPS